MKFAGIFIFLFGCFIQSKAQNDEPLALDENGKLIYYEVVTIGNAKKETLKNRALDFVKKQSKEIKLKSTPGDSTLIGTGKLIINKTLLVMGHPSGEVAYQFQVDVKEGKYRFWLTNFSFIPYQRDRYGNFVASTTKGTPLEENPGKLNEGQWKEYKSQTAKYAKEFADKFKHSMSSDATVKPVKEQKKVVRKEW